MICGIGLGDRLVGVSHECNWPPEVVSLPRLTRSRINSAAPSVLIDAQVKSLTLGGKPLYEVDGARLAALRPGLIVTQSQCDVCAVSVAEVNRFIAESPALAKAKVVALNPRSLGEMLADIERIGAVAGAAEQAELFTAALRGRIEAVRRAGDARRRPKRLAVIEWVDPLMVAGNWTPELAAIAGGRYDLATAGQPSPCIPWRRVLEYAPELLVVAPCGFNLVRSRAEAMRLEALPGWPRLPAVKSGQVQVVDGDAYFNRPSPRLVDSLEMLNSWLDEAS